MYLPICFRSASILFDLGSTFSYMCSYFSLGSDFSCEPLDVPMCVSTPVGDFSGGSGV